MQGDWRKTLKEHTREEVEAAKLYLKNNLAKCVGTASWFASSSPEWNINDVKEYLNQGCHASLPRMSEGLFTNVIALENGWRRRKHGKEQKNLSCMDPFLSWFLYYSPYGEFILNRDDYDSCRTAGFIVSGELPHGILMNLAIISRHFYEVHYDAFRRFNELTLEKGLDPTIVYSFVFNCYYSYQNYGNSYLNKKYMVYSGHRASNAYEPNSLVNIFKGVYGRAEERKMYRHKFTSGSARLFCTSDVYTTFDTWARGNQKFRNALAAWRRPDAVVDNYKPPNPFAPRDPYAEENVLAPGEFTYKECFDFVIEYTQTLVLEELAKKE